MESFYYVCKATQYGCFQTATEFRQRHTPKNQTRGRLKMQYQHQTGEAKAHEPCEGCSPMTRELNPCVKCRATTSPQSQKQATQQRRRNGFLGMAEEAFESPKEEREEVPQSPSGAMSGFERQLEASRYGGSQHVVQAAIATYEEKLTNRNFGMGFGNMLTAAYGNEEERMLSKDNSYLLAKPTTNGTFSGMRKKKETSTIELLAVLKARLRAVRKEGKEILVVYYEGLIETLERNLGISKPTAERSFGFIRMAEAAFSGR